MAEKILNTRIQLKYDTYANWTTNNPILKKGEMAIATIATGDTQKVNSVTPPQVLIKVGDGKTNYNALPFASGLAADVYSWAKKSEAEFKAWVGTDIDTDTQYQIVKISTNSETKIDTYELQSKAKGTSAWTKVNEFNLHTNDSVNKLISDAITALDLDNTYDAKGAAADVQSDLDSYKSTNNEAVAAAKKAGTDAQATIDAYKTANDAAVAAIKLTADAAAPKTYVNEELAKKQDTLVFNTEYNSTTNKVATMDDVKTATSGLTGAMHFIDTVSSDPTADGFNVSGYTKGDVVLYKTKEYVFNGTKFIELGDEGSYALKTISITGTDGLTGGGTLEESSTISLSEATKASLAKADTALQAADKTALEKLISDEATRATGVESGLNTRLTTAEGKLDTLNGEGAGSVKKALADAKSYADGLASNYATAAQGAKADTALQEITTTANGGLIVTGKNKIDIDNTVTFVFDCGNASGGSLQD